MKNYAPDDLLLGIDIGTGSVKVALMEISGRILGVEKKDHQIETPQQGWAEVAVAEIWENSKIVMQRLFRNTAAPAGKVRGVGMSCLCPGLTPMDAEGRALANSVIYMDCRSMEEAEEIRSRIGEDVISSISGNMLMPGAMSATSILWFRNKMPEIHRKTACYGHVNTYFGKKLTGKFGIDYSNASYTGLFETGASLQWSPRILEGLNLDVRMLPEIYPSWTSLGGLSDSDFIDAGIPRGTPVAMGGGDTACSALAVEVIEHNGVFESAGTTNVITVCSEKPVFDLRFMNRCHVVPKRWLYHGAMSSTGASVRWLRDEVFDMRNDSDYACISSMAEDADPGSPCPVFLPYMAGERSPVWDPLARGVFFGLGLHTRKEHLVRALFEACAFGNRQLLEIASDMIGGGIGEILSIGGWSAVDIWNRIKSDITKRTIRVLDISEAAVAGAALLGGIAAGAYASFHEAAAAIPKKNRKIFIPDPSNDEWYEKRFRIYTSLYPRLRDLFQARD